jgi:hypothetical protein
MVNGKQYSPIWITAARYGIVFTTPQHTLTMKFAAAIGMAAIGCSTQLRMVRTIVLRGSGVRCQLAGNRGCRSFERAGNGPHTDTSLSHACNRDAVLRLELQVSRLFLHVHTLQDRVLHFIFEAGHIYPANPQHFTQELIMAFSQASVRYPPETDDEVAHSNFRFWPILVFPSIHELRPNLKSIVSSSLV